MNFKRIFLIFLLIFFTFNVFPEQKPTSFEVKKSLHELLKSKYKETEKIKKHDEQFSWLEKLLNKIDLKKIIQTIRIPLIILIIALILFLLYKLLRSFFPYVKNSSYGKSFKTYKEKDIIEYNKSFLNDYYDKAIELSKLNNFNEACLLLHKATVIYIRDKYIINKKIEYTNNDLKKIIKKNENILYDAFSVIAYYSELIKFDNKDIDENHFNESLQQFEHSFLGT
jgi:hypothetical protein